MEDGSTGKGKTNMSKKKKVGISAEEGSGNVFADLGIPNPEQELLKAHLTLQIYKSSRSASSHRRRLGRSLASRSRRFPC
jgi:hypothetical protein